MFWQTPWSNGIGVTQPLHRERARHKKVTKHSVKSIFYLETSAQTKRIGQTEEVDSTSSSNDTTERFKLQTT